MAKTSHAVWGIDIGTCSLKALRLRHGAEGVEVVGFDYLEHSKIISTADITAEEKRQVIRETLRTFLKQNDVGKEEVAISIAGQNSFARLVKMPPVDPKRIPKIVPLEAVQQIPFDINEVEWDWQLLKNPESPDTEVGIFAIKNEVIAEMLDYFSEENLRVSCVQISPIALYNYAIYDFEDIRSSSGKATILLDMGAENTTLVIATRDSVWQRSIRIGGNTFTEAIADAFKLKFEKAEKLKRTAPMSKYMRQIFTAMKPVYTDLGGEIQRSLGFYTSSGAGRDKGFSRVLALGGGFKLQGLTKYLQQSLGLPVVKPDSFERLVLSPEISAAKFHENLSEFGVVYGLGVQLLGESKIETNLLPRRIARAMAWTRKAKIFTAAAAVFLVTSLICLLWTFRTLQQYSRETSGLRTVQSVMQQAQTIQSTLSEFESQKPMFEQQVQKELDLFKHREVLLRLNEILLSCFPNQGNTPEIAALYEAFVNGDIKTVRSVPRPDRKVMFITRLQIQFAPDLTAAALLPGTRRTAAGFGGAGGFGGEIGGFVAGPAVAPGGMMTEMTPGMPGVPGMPGGELGAAGAAPTVQAGFVVLIEGYSPYREIAQLLDPPGVGADQTRWGVITRFENLKTLFPEAPFELFGKGDIRHFKDEYGDVSLTDAQMPAGIGILREVERVPSTQGAGAVPGGIAAGVGAAAGMPGAVPTRVTKETVLIDPMTEEEISKTFDYVTQEDIKNNPNYTDRDLGRVKQTPFGEPQYIVRDHWFRIQAKFVWKDAPALPDVSAGGAGGGGFYPGASPTAPGGGFGLE